MLASRCYWLSCCDTNHNDIAFARSLNMGLSNAQYSVQDALQLGFPGNSFSCVTSIDVIEHVSEPHKMLQQIAYVLEPGGHAVITFPNLNFPLTYDPINAALAAFDKHLPIGAYGFGHFRLFGPKDFEGWAKASGFEIVEATPLSGYLSGLTEMYWVGLLQRLLKSNTTNRPSKSKPIYGLRPDQREPTLTKLTDLLIAADRGILKWSEVSVGWGYVLKLRNS